MNQTIETAATAIDTEKEDDTKVCIIGAGCSGFTMAKRLKEHEIDFDCFEISDDVGGNWYYRNPNGTSACYQSLHIDTSKWRLAFEDFPVPKDWPDFPHHSQMQQYFRDYVAYFSLRDHITFRTRVEECQRLQDGRWSVRVRDLTDDSERTETYTALIVANGHHWNPRLPEYPGQFDGHQIHSHDYRDPFEPYDFRDRSVLIVGAGNSAMDIASELSQKPLARRLVISMRRGVWVLPKYMDGKPADKAILPAWMPAGMARNLARRKIKQTLGQMEDYGLPKPDHEPLDAHPSVSGEFLTRVGCGDIRPKGPLQRLDGDGVVFADGSRETFDAIIWATGYNVTFPFLPQPELTPQDNVFPLYKRMVRPGFENLFFLGLAQPLPTLVNFAEQQSKLVAAALTDAYAFPDHAVMQRTIKADEQLHLGHFYDSPRHRMQLDFGTYVRDLSLEIKRGAKRRKQGDMKQQSGET